MDIITFLQSRGIRLISAKDGIRDKHISSGWYQCRCPICGGSKLWLGYNIDKGYFNCFSHGHASKYSLFQAWFPNENARELLYRLDQNAPAVEFKRAEQGTFYPPVDIHPLLQSQKHVDYIKSRNLDPTLLAKKWGVWALGNDTEYKYRNRLFFSVCDADGVPSSWLTRTITDTNTYRYLTAPKSRESKPIKSLLYGMQFVNPYDTIIVVEGVFDAFAVNYNAVATLGKTLTPEQTALIGKFQRRIICFDNEPETQIQASKLASELSIYPGVTDRVCLDAPDPATASPSELDSLYRYAEFYI